MTQRIALSMVNARSLGRGAGQLQAEVSRADT